MSWLWIAFGAGSVAAIVLFLDWSSRCHWKGVLRNHISFCLLALMRLYRDSATMLVVLGGASTPLFRVRLMYSIGDKSDLVFEVRESDLLLQSREELLKLLESQECKQVDSGSRSASDAGVVTVAMPVRYIWDPAAADEAANLANCLLDVVGVDRDARLDLSIRGRRSLERTLDARSRQRNGDAHAFPVIPAGPK